MTSCEEATYFINNCPNTKMDGDHDGVPCERQWCKCL
ncbi:excalibur calcium-binding domain-containing protein [Sulfurimonas sediminis]|uniref:Excalibur calcium-binding domain-containing protein n=1 Tax=Sulfurimonas sediminis TaxID=2590020 RepID=A0A7M1AYI6_9BACT|nr:excalibur calcium-binding domain-containing protein [Sulfurimonas sediminis]